MKLPRPPHGWNVTPSRALAIQRQLAGRVVTTDDVARLRLVVGLDAAFSSDGQVCVAAGVLWDVEDRAVVEERTACRRVYLPYIPGLLSFREAPALLSVLRKFKIRPDILMCDGQGLAHPRGFGIACHMGILTDLPVIGCAKSLLVGVHDALDSHRGARQALWFRDQRVGTVLRTRERVRPVYVSIGHRISLSSAEELVLACATRYRLPEPTRLADQLCGRVAHGA